MGEHEYNQQNNFCNKEAYFIYAYTVCSVTNKL